MANLRGANACGYKPESYYGILQRSINLNNSQSKRLVFALNFSDSDFVPTLTIRSAKGQSVHFEVEEWYEFFNELKVVASHLYDSKKTDYSHKVISNGSHSLQAVTLTPTSSIKLVKVLNCNDDYQVAYLGENTISRLIEMETGIANLWSLYTEKYQPKIIERYYMLLHVLMDKKHPFHTPGQMPENSVRDYYRNTVGHIFLGDIEFNMPSFGREVILQEIGFEKIYKDFVKFVDVMNRMGCYSSASNKFQHV
jgi:hypothetical protein